MKSEFIALDKATEEAEWLQYYFENIRRWQRAVLAICIHCGSQAAIGRAQSNMYRSEERRVGKECRL